MKNVKYRAIPVEKLVKVPSNFQTNRDILYCDALSDSLNQMAMKGWKLVTSCKNASGTIFVFEHCPFEEKEQTAEEIEQAAVDQGSIDEMLGLEKTN